MKNGRLRFFVKAAIIAAVYVALTLVLAPISYGPLQVRVSEAMGILVYFTPAAVPGLFVGCAIANLGSSAGLADIIIGSLATLAAAALGRVMPKKWLVPLPSVLINGLAIGAMLHFMFAYPLWETIAYISAGQAIACYGLGVPLMLLLEKYGKKLFD